MANQIIEGFDIYPTGNAITALAGSGWNFSGQAGNPLFVSNTVFANGTRSLRWRGNANQYWITRPLADNAVQAFGARLNYASGFQANQSRFGVMIQGSGGTLGFNCTDGNVRVFLDASDIYVSPGSLNFDVWNYIDIEYNRTAGTVSVYLNNNLLTTITSVANIGTILTARIGHRPTGATSTTNDIFVDDVYYNSGSGRWGEIANILLAPNDDGPNADWSPVGVSDGYEALDNVPPSTTEYIESSNVGDISDFEFPALPVGVFQVLCIDHVFRAQKTTAGPGDVQPSISIGGNVYPANVFTLTEAQYDNYIVKYETNPDTSSPWIVSDFAPGNILTEYERVA